MITLVIILYKSYAYPLGLGITTSGGFAMSNFDFKPGTSSSLDYSLGGGFVLDTAVAKIKRMNYRFYCGYENVTDSGANFFSNWSLNRLAISHVFGFSLYSLKYFRIWLGPQIEMAYQYKKTGGSTKKISGGKTSANIKIPKTYTVHTGSLHFGGVLGINFNPGEFFTISAEVGMQFGMGMSSLNIEYKEINIYYGILPGDPIYPGSSNKLRKRAFGKAECFYRISFIFRMGDAYSLSILDEKR